MREAFIQALDNLRANRLRSFLTMFGILWGIVSIVLLGAMGEGFARGNRAVLLEFGKNVGIIWGGRTSLQAGGERAGRPVLLTFDDVAAIKAESRLVELVSPEIQRNSVQVKSRYNAASVGVHGVEPPYQEIRSIELEFGRLMNWDDESGAHRVAIVGHDMAKQLFGSRFPIGETRDAERPELHHHRQDPEEEPGQQLQRAGQQQDLRAVRDDAVATFRAPISRPARCLRSWCRRMRWVVDDMPRTLETRTGRVEDIDWPMEREIRAILGRHKGFDPEDREAISMWDTSISTLMFARIIGNMTDFFTIVGLVTLALGGIGVMNIMFIAVKDRTREIGVRKALGATTRAVQRQFFLEGFFLTVLAGGLGFAIGGVLCAAHQPGQDARAVPGNDHHSGHGRDRHRCPRRGRRARVDRSGSSRRAAAAD